MTKTIDFTYLEDIEGFEGKYMLSPDGKVWSETSKKFLKPWDNGKGYLQVRLNGKKYYIHRLVAEHYIANPDNLPQIDHVDGNKANNNMSNLCWVSASENVRRSIESGLRSKARKHRRVHCIENGKIYKNCADAARKLGCCQDSVYRVCAKKLKTTHGFHFEFID